VGGNALSSRVGYARGVRPPKIWPALSPRLVQPSCPFRGGPIHHNKSLRRFLKDMHALLWEPAVAETAARPDIVLDNNNDCAPRPGSTTPATAIHL